MHTRGTARESSPPGHSGEHSRSILPSPLPPGSSAPIYPRQQGSLPYEAGNCTIPMETSPAVNPPPTQHCPAGISNVLAGGVGGAAGSLGNHTEKSSHVGNCRIQGSALLGKPLHTEYRHSQPRTDQRPCKPSSARLSGQTRS